MGGVRWSRVNGVVGAIVALFFGLYYNCACCAILPWLSYSVPGVVNLAILTTATSLSLAFFLMCVVVDPGGVPADWRPDEEDPTALVQVKKTTGGVRYCQKCKKHKPPRAHHCRVCKRCILRMDHHCPWINNCVGHHNYKAFLLFLLLAIIALIHSGTVLAFHQRHTMRLIHGRQDKPHQGVEPFSLSSWGVFIQVMDMKIEYPVVHCTVPFIHWWYCSWLVGIDKGCRADVPMHKLLHLMY
ncbi:unnamed protein product [Ostreobium quekettii]|uniref:S-acyltransferase n=1 Tax=Ostreobium quekettii TaxID=121088 RepID=A0A8S1IKD8_9CHLO|nr:unnamed protein product [Ostreobium quekettii]